MDFIMLKEIGCAWSFWTQVIKFRAHLKLRKQLLILFFDSEKYSFVWNSHLLEVSHSTKTTWIIMLNASQWTKDKYNIECNFHYSEKIRNSQFYNHTDMFSSWEYEWTYMWINVFARIY